MYKMPAGPKPFISGSNLLAMNRDPIGFLTNIAHEYGEIASFQIGSQTIVLLSSPDFIKEVLVTHHQSFIKVARRGKSLLLGNGLLNSEGEFHRRQRHLVQPAFHHQRIAAYGASMVNYAVKFRDSWQHDTTLDIASEMMQLTLAIVAKTLFNSDVESEAKEIGKAFTTILELFSASVMPFEELLEHLPLPRNRRRNKAIDFLNQTMRRIINERRANDKDQGDLLSMLLLARDEEGDGTGMTDEQVRDEAMTLFIAGHETTANALAWTWYLLSQHTEVEAKLHQEIDEVLGERVPVFQDLANLRYTEMVITESMRLYPPAWIMARRATVDYKIGGYHLPTGTIFLISPYVMHHHPKYFPSPEQFQPERWNREKETSRYTYFPFGGGPRQCIGERFAWVEAILLVATIAQQWRMRLAPKHKVELQPLVTLRPKNGLPMILTRR
jgi:cytochrome P450